MQDRLSFKDFYRREHQVLFDLIAKKLAQGECIDALTLSHEIKDIPELKEVNGEIYVLELLNQTYSTANISSYVEIVKEHSQRRQFKEILNYLNNHSDESNVKTLVQQAYQELAQLISTPLPEHHGIIYDKFSDIQSQAISWLWPNQIARSKVSIIAGNPGLGKSQITAYIAATVSSGGVWPVEETRCQPGGVIFLSAEDDPADTIRPRLEAVGADLSKTYLIKLVENKKGKEVKKAFNLKTDLPNLEKLLIELKDIALIVIDPITAYLGQTDSYNNAEVRGLLTPLSDLAAKYHVAIIAVSHLNKNSNQEALLRVAGSLAFVAAARTAFVVTHDPNDKKRRFLFPVKNNIAEDKDGFAFSIQSCLLEENQLSTSRVVWEEERISEDVMNLMKPPSDSEDNSVLKEAMDFLSKELAHSARTVNQLKKAANEYGLSWMSITRAKIALKIIPKKSGLTGGWVWSLPEELKKTSNEGKIIPFEKIGQILSKMVKPSEKTPNTNSLSIFEDGQANEGLSIFEDTQVFEQELNKKEDKIEQDLDSKPVVVEDAQVSESLTIFEDGQDGQIWRKGGDVDHLRQNLTNSEKPKEEDAFFIDVSDLLEGKDE